MHPEIDEILALVLERNPSDAVRRHVSTCETCQALARTVTPPADSRLAPECARFDGMIGGRGLSPADADALRDHLRACAECRELDRMASRSAEDLSDLPVVDPSWYEKDYELAAGGMGRTYHARDRRLGRVVAVKEARDPRMRARFEREARLTARLQHPSIVSVHEAGRWPDGTPFYAMQLVEGTPLDVRIAQSPTLASRLPLLRNVIAVAEAVAYAHGQGILHRDIKPQNVVLGAFGETVLIDWGLARSIHSPKSDASESVAAVADGMTVAGVGTPNYMPPEQARGSEPTERNDVYALGATLYHVLAGVPPFSGEADARRSLVERAPKPLRDLVPDVPRELESVVAKAMSRNPADRYASAKELASELERFQTGRLVSSHHYSLTEFARVWWRRYRTRIQIAALVAAGFLAFGALSFLQIVEERNRVRQSNAALLVEQGRQELLEGRPGRALALFDEAYRSGAAGRGLQYLIGSASRQVEARQWSIDAEAVDFSPDSTRLLGERHGRVLEWNVNDGSLRRSFDVTGHAAGYSRDGKWILASAGSDAVLLDAETGSRVRQFRHPEGNIDSLVISSDGTRIVTLGTAGKMSLAIWDSKTGKLVGSGDVSGLIPRIDDNVQKITRSGKHLVLYHFAGRRVEVWDIARARRIFALDSPRQIVMADINDAGDRLVTASPNGSATVWNTLTGKELHTLRAHSGVATQVHFLPDDKRVLVGATLGSCTIWDVDSGELLLSIDSTFGDFEISEDGTIATVGNGVQLWSSDDGTLLASFERGNFVDDNNGRILFSPNGDWFVVTRGDSETSLWNARAGRLRYRLETEDIAPPKLPPDPLPLVESHRKRYRLKARLHGDGRCLEGSRISEKLPRHGLTGGSAFMDLCQNVSGQAWWMERIGDRFLLKTDFQGNDRCLEGTAHGAFLERCQPTDAQQWSITPLASGFHQIATAGKCLEANSREVGAVLDGATHLAECTKSPGQHWRLETPWHPLPEIGEIIDDVRHGRIFYRGPERAILSAIVQHGKPGDRTRAFADRIGGLSIDGDEENTLLLWTDERLVGYDLDTDMERWTLVADSNLRGGQTSWLQPQALLLQHADGDVRIVDLASGIEKARLRRPDSTGRGSSHPCADAACVLVQGSNGVVSLSRLDGSTISVIEGLSGFIAPDEDRPPNAGLRGERRILVTAGGARVVSWLPPDQSLPWTPGNTVRVWDGRTGKRVFDVPPGMGEFTVSRNGDALATLNGRSVEIRSLWTGELLSSVRADDFVALASDFDVAGDLLATSGANGVIRIWDWRSEMMLDEFRIPPARPGVIPEAYTCCDFTQVPKLDFRNGYLRTTAATWHAVWDTRLDSRSAAEIARLVETRVPWRLEDGRLVPRAAN